MAGALTANNKLEYILELFEFQCAHGALRFLNRIAEL